MSYYQHLDDQKIDNIALKLLEIENSLKGLGGLFQHHGNDTALNAEELFGIGQLLKKLAYEVSIIEDLLRCGYDSRNHER